MRIRTQLLIAAAAAAVVAVIVIGSLWYVTQRSAANLRSQADSQDIARNVANLLTLTQEYTVYGGDRAREQWHARYAQLRQTVEQALARESVPHPALAEMHERVLELLPLYEGLERAFRDGGSDLAQRRGELMVERLMSGTQELVDARYRWATTIVEQQAREQSFANAIVLASSAVLLVLIVGLAVLVSRRGLVPLAKLQAATAAIQRGDLSVRCESSSRDELGETGRAVNAMAESLLAANAALHESEERYQLAVAGSNEGLWDWDLTTNMIYLSPRAQEIRMGRASDGIDTRHESEWQQWYQVHPDDAARHDAARRDHLEGRTPRYEGEWRVRHLDGSYHWIHARGICTRDASGRAIRFAGSTTDIDARKGAEDALRKSEERYARTMEAAGDGHSEWNVETGEFYVSPRLLEICGHAPDATFHDRAEWVRRFPFHPEDRPKWEAAVAAHFAGRDARFHMELRIVVRGETRWLALTFLSVRDASGRPIRWTGATTDITERKLAEEAWRESEQEYRTLFDSIDEGFCTIEVLFDENVKPVDYRFLQVNPSFERQTGIKNAVGRRMREIAPQHEEHWFEIYGKIALTGEPMRFENEAKQLGRWYDVYAFRLEDPKLRRVGILFNDITERKLAEEELRASEVRFRGLTELSSDWYWEQDENLCFTYLSSQADHSTGYSSGPSIGKMRWDLRGITPLSSSWAEHQAVLAARQPFRDFECSRVAPDGSLRYLSISGAPIFDEQGGFKGYQGIGRNITERKRIEEELRARQDMLDLAQKAARAVAFEWRIGAGPGQNRWSPDLEVMYGLAPGSYDGTYDTWKQLVLPEDWPAVKAAIERAEETGDVAADYRVLHSNGTVHWLQAKARMLFDAGGQPARVVGFMLDVTEPHQAEEELRRMERQLRQAQRLEAMGTLAGGIAHDFNNILGAILGYGEMALRDAAKGSRLRRDLDSIVTAGERGRALVERILAFSRSSMDEVVAVHVERVAHEALDQLAAKLPANVTIAPRLHAGPAAVLGDPTQVHQVLMNLATNAVHAMPSGGTLRVLLQPVRLDAPHVATTGTVEVGDYVVLEVADSGVGIAPDVLERIFDPFFTTKEVGVGTGLGLSLVHGIVTELGGAIDVASAPGAGSTFTVYLPRAGDAVEVDASEMPDIPRGNHERVLVVDDEEPLVRIATETLEGLGYRPVGFTSSSAALEAFRADPLAFDAVITDERMPGMSGSTLIREVRGIRAGIPTMLMSGFVGGTVSSRAREAGADDVLKKPLSARDLATSLARAIGLLS